MGCWFSRRIRRNRFWLKTIKMVTVGNNNVGLNLNFSGNNLYINGNVPKAGQVLISNGPEQNVLDTDYTLVSNQIIKVVTEMYFEGIFKLADILDLNSGVPNYTQTYTVHDGYTIMKKQKK